MSLQQDIIQYFSYPGLFILPILGSLGLPVPEEAILILCGVLISESLIKPVPAVIAVYSGVIISDFIIFSIGRRYGRALVTHKRFQKILSPEKLTIVEDKFNKFGPCLIFFGRHLIGLRSQLFLISGIMGMPPNKFIMTDAVAALITVTVMVTAGYTGFNMISYVHLININTGYVISALLIALILIYAGYRYIRWHRSTVRNKVQDNA
jgi:membrane protein DedA with SNARE-associated domain